VILNRRSLLASVGLTLSAATAEAAAATKKKKKVAPIHTTKVASHKTHHTAKPKAPTQS
jgi:hypothetical protein